MLQGVGRLGLGAVLGEVVSLMVLDAVGRSLEKECCRGSAILQWEWRTGAGAAYWGGSRRALRHVTPWATREREDVVMCGTDWANECWQRKKLECRGGPGALWPAWDGMPARVV